MLDDIDKLGCKILIEDRLTSQPNKTGKITLKYAHPIII